MDERPKRYSFAEIKACNFCGSPPEQHKVLGKRMNRSQGREPWKKTGISTTVVRCRNCGLHFTNPLPIPFELSDHYGIPPENYWKPEYFQSDEHYFEGEISRLKTLMSIEPGMKALDIGAGLGKAMIALNKAGFDTFGIEPSLPFYERAISKMGIRPDRLSLGKAEDLPYAQNSFDFVTFGAVLEHLYDPAEAIRKALHCMKPGAILHIEVPSSRWLIGKLMNLYYRLRGSDYVGNLSPMHEPFHLYEFSLDTFLKQGKRMGYELVLHEYYVCQTYLPGFVGNLAAALMRLSNTGMQLCVWLKKTEGMHSDD